MAMTNELKTDQSKSFRSAGHSSNAMRTKSDRSQGGNYDKPSGPSHGKKKSIRYKQLSINIQKVEHGRGNFKTQLKSATNNAHPSNLSSGTYDSQTFPKSSKAEGVHASTSRP